MATLISSPETAGMEAFCASLPSTATSSKTFDRLRKVGHYRKLKSGSEIRGHIRRDRLVFLVAGATKMVAATANSKAFCEHAVAGFENPSERISHILAFHFPGEFITIINQADGDVRLTALTDAALVLFPFDRFLDVAQDDPAIIRHVISRSVQSLYRCQARMLQITHKSARQRIAGFLVSMARNLGSCNSGSCEFTLPMTRKDIADSLGLTIETVSRQFANFTKSNLIKTRGRNGLLLLDISRLQAEAG